MFRLLHRLFCIHYWINILKLGGEVTTRHGSYPISGTVYIDYCPKCESFRERHYDR